MYEFGTSKDVAVMQLKRYNVLESYILFNPLKANVLYIGR